MNEWASKDERGGMRKMHEEGGRGAQAFAAPDCIEVRGARVHNLKNIDVDIPLGKLVGMRAFPARVKARLPWACYTPKARAATSMRFPRIHVAVSRKILARRSTKCCTCPRPLRFVNAQGIPGVHSTFGTSTELLNYLRLLFSRVAEHVCPHGHYVPASVNVALEKPLTCPVCGVEFFGPGAEELAFNSAGACPACSGTGVVREVDESTLVPDESLSIQDGAVASWRQLMWSLMPQVAQEMGVRIDVPFRELTEQERDIVFHGPAEKRHIIYQSPKTGQVAELDFTYFNAVYTVENSLSKAKDEKGLARVAKFLKEGVCPDCGGTRLAARARAPRIGGVTLPQASAMALDELSAWVASVPDAVPSEVRDMARAIVGEMAEPMRRLQQLGLGYLSLDRASFIALTGERQRVQLARAVRGRTTGALYVLDEHVHRLAPLER